MDFAECQAELVDNALGACPLIDDPDRDMRDTDAMPRDVGFTAQYRGIDCDMTNRDNRHSQFAPSRWSRLPPVYATFSQTIYAKPVIRQPARTTSTKRKGRTRIRARPSAMPAQQAIYACR